VIFLDLALQGFRDLSGSMRVRLQSGYNALISPTLSGETLVQGFLELLFSGERGPANKSAKSGGGVSMMAADGTTLRAIRDFTLGTGQLLEFDRQAKAFKPIATESADVDVTVRSRLSLPTRAAFEAVYVLRPRDLPSRANSREPKSESKEPEAPPPDPEVLRARLAELEKILADLKLVEDLEFELDGLQKQRFDFEDRARALVFDDTDLKAAEVEERRLSYLNALPGDFLARHDAYVKLVERRDADLKRWQAERQDLESADRQVQVTPLSKDARLWGGLVVGGLAVVAAAVLGGLFRYIALLDIPAFGVVALVIFKALGEREIRDQIRWKLRLSTDRKEKIESRDGTEIKAVEEMLKTTGLADVDEVRRALSMRAQVNARLATLRTEAEKFRGDPERARILGERDAVTARVTAIEERLTRMTALPVESASLKAEAASIGIALAKLAARPAPAAAPAEAKAELTAWFKVAQDLLLTDADSAARTLSERASLIIRALSGNRIAAVVFDANGDVFMRTAQGGSAKWAAMPDSARDLVYLALRGALYLAVDPKIRAPMLTYDLAAACAGGQEVEQALLVTLAHAGQLVHIVRRPEQAPKAKHVASVEVGA
jgi:hypothetical protein